MPDLLSTIQAQSKETALTIIAKGPETVAKLKAAKLEGSPSALFAKFSENNFLEANPVTTQAVDTVLDAIDTINSEIIAMEQYIHLTIPKMEDGNNFGVTVQLAAIKHMADAREKMDKAVEELSAYAAKRAEALEKCGNLVSKSESKTVTATSSQAQGGKDGNVNETKEASESKTLESNTTKPSDALRKKAVWDVDVLFYTKAKRQLEAASIAYLSSLDFCDKNSEKLAEPKGSNGGRGYSSMY